MRTRSRLAALACVPLLVALGGCSGDSSSSDATSSSSGPQPCSDFADGETITEDLSMAGCEDPGVTEIASTSCGGGKTLIAVGPVYGFVGKPANYLGDGEDATKSAEWEKFQQDCPYDSE